MTGTAGRRLFGSPILLQDWDQEADEGAAQFWELFLDLLLVAAASSIADNFKEHIQPHSSISPLASVLEFAVLYFVTVNGWMLYTHHISARFEDSSMSHSIVLFVFMLGLGICIVNSTLINPESVDQTIHTAQAFALGAIVQRVIIIVMLAGIAQSIKRAQAFSFVLCAFLTISTLSLWLCYLSLGHFSSNIVAMSFLACAAIWELFGEFVIIRFLSGNRLVPVNIEHSKERLGALELIMLGETVLSVTLTYRELSPETSDDTPYYLVLGLAFLLVYMFTLLLFHVQPEPRDHAFRRSRIHGLFLIMAHKVLGLALLAVGVSIKLVVHAVVLDEPMSLFGSRLMGCSVSAALLIVWLIRVLHYGNREAIYFGPKMLVFGNNSWHDTLALTWWWVVALCWILPLMGVLTGITTHNPIVSMSLHSGLLFGLCVMESSYTHYFSSVLPDTRRLDEPIIQEEQTLFSAETNLYSSTDYIVDQMNRDSVFRNSPKILPNPSFETE